MSTRSLESAKRRQVVQITARSFFDEMVDYGFNERDVIQFTTDILDLLMRSEAIRSPQSVTPPPSYDVQYTEGSDGAVREIIGPHLTLAPLSEGDLPMLQRWREAETFRGTLIERIFEPPVESLPKRFTGAGNHFFLARLEGHDPLGFLTFEQDREAPWHAFMQKFVARRRNRGQGFGTQMTYLWLHYAFTRLGLRKVTARTADSNLVNINLNRRLGFRFEGHLRDEVRLRDEFVDVTVMSVFQHEFLPPVESTADDVERPAVGADSVHPA